MYNIQIGVHALNNSKPHGELLLTVLAFETSPRRYEKLSYLMILAPKYLNHPHICVFPVEATDIMKQRNLFPILVNAQ